MLAIAVGPALLVASPANVAAQASPARAHTIALSPAQMFRVAELAQSKSDLKTAFTVYAALERNPDPDIRAEARFRHASDGRMFAQSGIKRQD